MIASVARAIAAPRSTSFNLDGGTAGAARVRDQSVVASEVLLSCGGALSG
jgi:hypothetical protein